MSDPLPAGEHDFDDDLGTWTTTLRRLLQPLAGASEWAEYQGTTLVREVLGGPANLVELDATGPAGRVRALSLRLFDPATGLWTLNFAHAAGMSEPAVGRFAGATGEFLGTDQVGSRHVDVRFVIDRSNPDTRRFEQSFSADGGRTWELNWVAVDQRDT